MSCDYLIYIGSLFGTFCYITEFSSVINIYNTLEQENKYIENKNLNIYAWKLRICILTANGCFLTYNKINNSNTQLYSFTFYVSLDSVLLTIRSYYMYWFNKKLQQNIQPPINIPTENPLHV